MFELFMYVYSCNALSARFFAVDRALNSYFMAVRQWHIGLCACVKAIGGHFQQRVIEQFTIVCCLNSDLT